MRHLLLTTIVLLGCTADIVRAEPAKAEKKIDELPPPTPVGPPVPSRVLPYYLPSSLPQPGTREVWQYYGVDSRGRWLPRVIMSPSGAYYYYNGAPFPYTTTRPSLFMPYVVD